MSQVRVIGIFIENRIKEAGKVQEILTSYGCSIKTRIGLHDTFADVCSPKGLVILELAGDPAQWDKLEEELKAVEGVDIQKMNFSFQE